MVMIVTYNRRVFTISLAIGKNERGHLGGVDLG